MLSFEDVKKYLPQYLSAESTKSLFKNLEDFPDNIDERLYTTALKDYDVLFQGDGVIDFLVVNLPETKTHQVPVMIISNSCDMSPDNQPSMKPNLIYVPIIKLAKYKKILEKIGLSEEAVKQNIITVKKQHISQMLYLPVGGMFREEHIALLDKVNNCKSSFIKRDEITTMRLFSLSDYGFYLFLFKLSIHFTRIQEKVDRREGVVM